MSGIRKSYLEKKNNELAKKFQSDKKISKFLKNPKFFYKSDNKTIHEFSIMTESKENIMINGKENINLDGIKKNLFGKEDESNTTNNIIKTEIINEIKPENKNKRPKFFFRSKIKLPDECNKELFRRSQPLKLINQSSACNINRLNTINCEIDNFVNSALENVERSFSDRNIENESEEDKYLKEVKNKKFIKQGLTKGTLAIIQMEQSHSETAIKENLYISLVNNENNNICFRLGIGNMCTCGHGFIKHSKLKNNFCQKCSCQNFQYIPLFPEETDLYRDAYLLDFEYENWKACCECEHNWTEHNFLKNRECNKCECKLFKSDFNCGVCGRAWEEHKILYETKEERKRKKKTYGEDYKPFTKEQLDELFKI